MTQEIVIKTQDLKQTYKMGRENSIYALRGIDFELKSGEFVALVGASGSGKSTFMHLVGLLQRPTGGKIFIEGVDVTDLPRRKYSKLRAKKIGFIFQGFNLIPTLSARENVILAARYAGTSNKEAKKNSEELLKKLGLADRMNHRPSELSGGQQQRVAIARALVNNPAIILADEPTGELDSKTSAEIVELLHNLSAKGQTILMVTHNEDVAKKAHREVRMADGKIISDQKRKI